MSEERPPIHESINVVAFKTLYKTDKWWSTVVIGEGWGRKKVYVYLHQMTNGSWKRKQKITIGSKQNWTDMKAAVEELLPQAFGN